MFDKLFVDSSNIEIVLDTFFTNDGEYVASTIEKLLLPNADYQVKKMVFTFSRPSYDRINNYRRIASEFVDGQYRINPVTMRECFIIYHLQSLSLDGVVLDTITVDKKAGRLTEDSMKKINTLNPSILDLVLVNLEKKIGV